MALIILVAAALALTYTLAARPLIAIPGGLLATLAWAVSVSMAAHGSWELAALLLVPAGVCSACTVEAARSVSADQRAADEQAEEALR